ncbi:MAG TPA: tripartite tricarboxylate transporter substrate-binding protein [Xanthobacteraceae bacterium]
MCPSKSRAMIAALAVLAAATAPASAQTSAQTWPDRPLTMVIPFAAGGAVDVMGRILAARLTEVLGQRVIIENVGGAGGMNGAYRVVKAPADGYEFVLGSVGTHAQNQSLYKKPLYNASTDFAPVALIAETPLVMVARKDLPADNLQEFMTYARANQAKLQYGSAGTGSANQLACMLLNAAIGITVTHVPYRGGEPAIQDLIAGRIDYACSIITTAVPQIEGGLVKAITITTKTRSPLLPNLATAQEQGLKDFEAYTWNAFFMPKGTPEAIVKKLNAATIETMNTPAVQERLRDIGATIVAPERRSSEYLAKFVASEIEKWAGPIKASGAVID